MELLQDFEKVRLKEKRIVNYSLASGRMKNIITDIITFLLNYKPSQKFYINMTREKDSCNRFLIYRMNEPIGFVQVDRNDKIIGVIVDIDLIRDINSLNYHIDNMIGCKLLFDDKKDYMVLRRAITTYRQYENEVTDVINKFIQKEESLNFLKAYCYPTEQNYVLIRYSGASIGSIAYNPNTMLVERITIYDKGTTLNKKYIPLIRDLVKKYKGWRIYMD